MFNDLAKLRDYGFSGFHTVDSLMKNNCDPIPTQKGVYIMLNPDREKSFLDCSVGGRFKGKDPTVSTVELENNWVGDTLVLYVGQTTSQTLRKRIQQFMRFGQENPVGHWGGRYVWQLRNNRNLQICFKALPDSDPPDEEATLLQMFKSEYGGKRPFANLQG